MVRLGKSLGLAAGAVESHCENIKAKLGYPMRKRLDAARMNY